MLTKYYGQLRKDIQSVYSGRHPLHMHKKRANISSKQTLRTRVSDFSYVTALVTIYITCTVINHLRSNAITFHANYLKFIVKWNYKLDMSNLSIIQSWGHTDTQSHSDKQFHLCHSNKRSQFSRHESPDYQTDTQLHRNANVKGTHKHRNVTRIHTHINMTCNNTHINMTRIHIHINMTCNNAHTN